MLKEIWGHKSITMTQRYAHLSPQFKKAAIGKMNTIWAAPPMPQVGTPEDGSEPIPVTTASQNSI